MGVPGIATSPGRDTTTTRPALIVLVTACLYFAQGVPLGFVFGAYPTLMRSAGASLATIAWVPLLGLPWVFKFLWAPLIDTRWIGRIGRRRTWLLSMQAVMIAAMTAIALIEPRLHNWLQLALLAGASLASATQDIATDGLAAERLRGHDLGTANVLAVGCMTMGFLAGGGGTLIAVDLIGRSGSVLILVALLALAAIPTLVWREGAATLPAPAGRLLVLSTLRRPDALILLALAFLFASGHAIDDALSRLLMVDRGLALSTIGTLQGIGMAAMAVVGCGTASLILRRHNAAICIVAGLVMMVMSATLWLALSGASDLRWPLLITAKVLDGVGMGLSSSGVFTMVMTFASGGRHTGTDVTVFKSANVLGEIGWSSAATAVAAVGGYTLGFGLAVTLAVCAIGLVLFAGRSMARLRSLSCK